MAALMRRGRVLRNIIKCNPLSSGKFYSTETSESIENHDSNITTNKSINGLSAAGVNQRLTEHADDPGQKFASLLRKSKFVQIGDLRKTVVVGEIFEVMDDDLYINFGSKFYCVCKKPRRMQIDDRKFQRGSKVKILLQDYEMTASFMATSKDVTLLESDATLLGSISPGVLDDEEVETFRKRTVSKEPTNWEEKEPAFDIRTFISEVKEMQ
ncbi:small ribosomal subunit protein bS1m-like [Argopecten irradians]|uniref:small ribosomal subunit protein bS1m-like n=1 Tax=Argopecten irradians TaxID=31199 RepID=UPI00371BB8E9